MLRNVVRTGVCTSLSQGTGVWGVRVTVVITEIFGNVVTCQLGHNVGDVAKGAEVLQPLMSTTLWRKTSTTLTAKTPPAADTNVEVQVQITKIL